MNNVAMLTSYPKYPGPFLEAKYLFWFEIWLRPVHEMVRLVVLKYLFSLIIALYLFICGCSLCPPRSLGCVWCMCFRVSVTVQEGSSRRLYERAAVSKWPMTSQFTQRSQRYAPNSLTHTHCETSVCLLPCMFSSFAKLLFACQHHPFSVPFHYTFWAHFKRFRT